MARKEFYKPDMIRTILSSLICLLSEQEKTRLLSCVEVCAYRKNDYIFREGEITQYICVVATGNVRITKQRECGRSQILSLLGPTEFFGYKSFFANVNHTTDASAVDSAIIYRIPTDVINDIAKFNPNVSVFFLEKTAVISCEQEQRYINLVQKHVRGRMAESLLLLYDKFGTLHDKQTIAISLMREDIALFSNMTTANAIRTLSSFVSEGLVRIDGRKIAILNVDALMRISLME